MTTDELIRDVAKRSGMHLCEVRQALNGLTEAVVAAVAAGETVKIEGLGAFYTRERAAKLARNWSTGEPLLVPACRVPAFKAWKQLKQAVK